MAKEMEGGGGGWARSLIRDYITWGCLSNIIIVSLKKYNLYKTFTHSFNNNIIYFVKLSEMKYLTITPKSINKIVTILVGQNTLNR